MFTLFAQRRPSRSPAKRGLGFTLIELTLAIVVVGILGAIAISRHQNISEQAQSARVAQLVANFETASVNNSMARRAGSSKAVVLNNTVCSVATLPKLLEGGQIPHINNVLVMITPLSTADNCAKASVKAVTCQMWAYNDATGAHEKFNMKIACAR